MATCKCENGWVEIDDQWVPCKNCNGTKQAKYPQPVAAYTRRLAELMGLRDWDIMVLDEPCRDDCFATTLVAYGQKRAEITLHKNWNKLSGREQRNTLVHELLHCHLAYLNQLNRDMLALKGDKVARYTETAWYLAEEFTVDGIATSWCEFLPLPTGGRCAR